MLYFFLLGNSGRGSRDSGVQGGINIFHQKFTFSGADIFLGFFFLSMLYYYWPIMHEYQLLLSIVTTLANTAKEKLYLYPSTASIFD